MRIASGSESQIVGGAKKENQTLRSDYARGCAIKTNNKLITFSTINGILQRRRKRGRETTRILHNSVYIETLRQKERRKEGDGESATETNVYEELITAPKETDIESGNALGQELHATQKEEGGQEVGVVEIHYDNPGEGTSSRSHGSDHYDNLS